MKLTKGIYYFDCTDFVYLRNVKLAKDYQFNPIVLDILNVIQANPDCEMEDICTAMAKIYDIADLDALREDVESFLQELIAEQIVSEEVTEEIAEGAIHDQVQDLYQNQGRLFSATLELTYRCNEKCIHCYIDDVSPENVKRELTLEEYKGIIDQLKDMGCVHLLLTGGEVCVRRDFLDIAQYAVDAELLVDVYTNGIAMTDAQFDRLCAMKVNSVSFSMYSADPSVHDAITKVPGSFEKSLKRMMMFKCAGMDTFMKTVVIQQNLDSLPGLFELGRRLNIPVNPATNISDTHTGASKGCFRLKNQQQRLQAAMMLQKYEPVKLDGLHRNLDGLVCKAGITALSIDPYGGVHPCLAFTESIGSVREQPLEEIWRNAPMLRRLRSFRFRELSDKCSLCGYADTCGVCIGAAYSESGGRFCPNSDSCGWAKANYDAANAVL